MHKYEPELHYDGSNKLGKDHTLLSRRSLVPLSGTPPPPRLVPVQQPETPIINTMSGHQSGSGPSFTPPARQTAATVNDNDEVTIWHEAPCPSLPADQVYVRVDAVALNPSDTKMRGDFATPWAFLGTDYCGTVLAVGPDVGTDLDIKVGDRVYGAQNEMCPRTPDQGAFAQYTVTRGRIWAKVPDGWSTEAAASLPAGISTAGLALKLLGIPLPYTGATKPAKTTYVLVYGGSTATASITMQFLREYVLHCLIVSWLSLSRITVTTCTRY